jgi:lysophospholipase L1-like esterase
MPASGGPSGGAEAPRLRAGRRELALALASIGVTLLLVDAGLRLRYRLTHGGAPLSSYFRHDPLLGWAHRPGVRVRVGFPEAAAEVAINAAGFRDRERDPFPAPGERRILALGDSFVEGWAVPEREGVAPVLEELLRASGRRVEVVNAGVSGYSTDQELLLYRTQGRGLRPHLVLLFFCGNDVVYNAQADYWSGAKPYFAIAGDRLELQGVPVPNAPIRARADIGRDEGAASSLRALVRSALAVAAPRLHDQLAPLGPWPRLERRPPPDERRALERRPPAFVEEGWERTQRLLRLARDEVAADGARFAIVYVPDRVEVAERHRRIAWQAYGWTEATADASAVRHRLRAIADASALPLLDPTDALRAADRGLFGGPYFADGIHWNARGHRVVAESVASALAEQGLLP